jgi:hypothetical protein
LQKGAWVATLLAGPNDGNLWYKSFHQNDLIDKLSKQKPNTTTMWCSMPATTTRAGAASSWLSDSTRVGLRLVGFLHTRRMLWDL